MSHLFYISMSPYITLCDIISRFSDWALGSDHWLIGDRRVVVHWLASWAALRVWKEEGSDSAFPLPSGVRLEEYLSSARVKPPLHDFRHHVMISKNAFQQVVRLVQETLYSHCWWYDLSFLFEC